MKICFFGSYIKDSYGIPSGNGGTLLKKILETQNVELVECHESIESFFSFIPAYFKLFFKHRKLDYDIMMIPWRGILSLPLAKIIHKKPIIYFPSFSIYDTLVNDRKTIEKNSLKAKFVHFVDKTACRWSDLIILESTEEINYFVKEYGLQEEKFRQCPLAADESIFNPLSVKNQNTKFVVLYFGSFIPLHGVETIVNAALILKKYVDIEFRFCGKGQTKDKIENIIEKNNLTNVKLLGLVPKEELLDNIKKSDICLGIFGDTLKAQKVVTNKVFQILASRKPLITIESPASLESNLTNKKNCMLVPPANPEKLSEAILFLKNDFVIRQQIAEEGYKTFNEHLSMRVSGKKLLSFAQELILKQK